MLSTNFFIRIGIALIVSLKVALAQSDLSEGFNHPPASARPWVYWYFMDGNLTEEGMFSDLQAMKDAGIGGAILLEVNLKLPVGPTTFMSPQWQHLIVRALQRADQLGIQIALGTGPGWCGTGGPWITPELAMQDLVASKTEVTGGSLLSLNLPKPAPPPPYFGEGSLTPELKHQWQEFYRDVAVIAFPTPLGTTRLDDIGEKALYVRDPFSSKPKVKPFLPAPLFFPPENGASCLSKADLLDLSFLLDRNGHLNWQAPPGEWTILRLGRRLTGQTTRPAPLPGLGLESDKFDKAALDFHYNSFIGKLLKQIPPPTNPLAGLTMLHFDSWEMGSQNWTGTFREEFKKRRGYDPLPYLPTLSGYIVQSTEISERFLWDLRETAQQLAIENHVGHLAELAHKAALTLSVEPYDINPFGDLTLGRVADVPQGEFWHVGHDTNYSVVEAVSIGHTCGKPIIAAEAFTASAAEAWTADPAALKTQGDWAFCTGINRFIIHRFQAQPWNDRFPGMTMGPYGVHWDRTQTWWSMVSAYHSYLSRSQFLLQQGVAVADVCFLDAEGAPDVFRPPSSATNGNPPYHLSYNFDGCSPETLIERAQVINGKISFAGGTTYELLVLPERQTMTLRLLKQIEKLTMEGATIFGPPPIRSPSLQDFPNGDAEVASIAQKMWGNCDGKRIFEHPFGKGTVIWKSSTVQPSDQYGDYQAVIEILNHRGIVPDFVGGNLHFAHRKSGTSEIYFVANASDQAVLTDCQFRVHGMMPEIWNPLDGKMSTVAQFEDSPQRVKMPLYLPPKGSLFVVFRQPKLTFDPIKTFMRNDQPLALQGGEPTATLEYLFNTKFLSDTTVNLNIRQPGKYTIKTYSGSEKSVICNDIPPPLALLGTWDVSFNPKWGGPQNILFDTLTDWTLRPEEGIQHYSGLSTYRKTFNILKQQSDGSHRYILDLGQVKNLARIRLNGQECGILWCAPWRMDVTAAVVEGSNQLEIQVANLWPNRLIGDKMPGAKTFTWTTLNPYVKDSKLLSSGLLGPVNLVTECSLQIKIH